MAGKALRDIQHDYKQTYEYTEFFFSKNTTTVTAFLKSPRIQPSAFLKSLITQQTVQCIIPEIYQNTRIPRILKKKF